MRTYTVKNVKTFQGREGNGFDCSLYCDGKKIGKAVDTADGGPFQFYLDAGHEGLLDAYCETLPFLPWGFEAKNLDPRGMSQDKDIFVGELVETFLQNRDMKTRCRTHIVFTLKSDENPNNIWTIKGKYSINNRDHLMHKYGDDLKEIINERYM